MQNITIVTIGKIKNQNILNEIENISKKLNRVKFIELRDVKEKNLEIQKKKEYELLRPLIKTSNHNILLWEHAKTFKTEDLYKKLKGIEKPIFFFITGPYGPNKKLIQEIDNQLSLSPLTFTHEMAKQVLIEQIYRLQTIEQGKDYHK